MICMTKIRGLKKPLLLLALPLFVVFSVALSPFSSSASALEIDSPFTGKWTSGSINLSGYGGRGCWTWHTTGLSCGNDPTSNSKYLVDNLYFTVSGNRVVQGNSNYLISFTYTVKAANTESFIGMSSGSNFLILDQTLTQSGDQFHGSVLALTQSDSSGGFAFYSNTTYNQATTFSILITEPSLALMYGTGKADNSTIEQYLADIKWNSAQTQTKLETIINDFSVQNQYLSTIAWNSTETQTKLETIIAALGASNTGGNTTNNILNEQLAEDKKQTEQQKEQYEQEKQEEKDREDAANEDAEKAQGIFNFSISNPFNPLFDMFNPRGCVSIPTIASWLHSESSQYCSWFPSSVTSVLTPVFSLSSMMILFGFVVAWLNGSDANGSITIKGGL